MLQSTCIFFFFFFFFFLLNSETIGRDKERPIVGPRRYFAQSSLKRALNYTTLAHCQVFVAGFTFEFFSQSGRFLNNSRCLSPSLSLRFLSSRLAQTYKI